MSVKYDQFDPASVQKSCLSDPPDGRYSVFSDRPDFPVSGTSTAAAHYGAEVGQKITQLVG
jgi:hypothetical protein